MDTKMDIKRNTKNNPITVVVASQFSACFDFDSVYILRVPFWLDAGNN